MAQVHLHCLLQKLCNPSHLCIYDKIAHPGARHRWTKKVALIAHIVNSTIRQDRIARQLACGLFRKKLIGNLFVDKQLFRFEETSDFGTSIFFGI